MSLNLRVENVTGRPGPERALLFVCTTQWVGSELGFLLSLDGRLSFHNRVISEPMRVERVHWPEGQRATLRRDQSFRLELVAPFSNAAISFVEQQRTTEDVALQLEFQYQWQEARREVNGAVVVG